MAQKVQLNDVLIKQAGNAIIHMVRDAHKGGANSYVGLLKKVEEKEAGLSSHIYGLALTSSKMAKGKLDIAGEWFLAMCRAAEAHLREVSQKELGHEVTNVKDELPCWPVFKSEIKRAIAAGADPINYPNLSALKTARIAIEEQRSSRERDNNHNETGGEGTEGGSNAGTSSETTKVVPTLRATLDVMQKRIKGMTDEQQELFAAKLGELLSEFASADQPEDVTTDEVASGEAQEASEERKAG